MRHWRIALTTTLWLAASAGQLAAQSDTKPSSDWSHVTRLAPGTAMTVSIEDLPTLTRTMVYGDDSGLVLLNPLAIADKRDRSGILDLVAHHAEDLIATQNTVVFERIRVAPDGVFANGRKVAERDETFHRVPREGVVEITAKVNEREAQAGAAALGAVGGFFLGALVGSAVQPPCNCDDPGMTGAVFGAPIGAVLGGIAAARLVRPTRHVIYRRAPGTPTDAAYR